LLLVNWEEIYPACRDNVPIEHPAQTQRVYRAGFTAEMLQIECITQLQQMRHTGTVVDFVAVKTSGFNSFQ
jgi:hypothetical protein